MKRIGVKSKESLFPSCVNTKLYVQRSL